MHNMLKIWHHICQIIILEISRSKRSRRHLPKQGT